MTYRPSASNLSPQYGTSAISEPRQTTMTEEGHYHSSRSKNCKQTIDDPWHLLKIFANLDRFTGDPKKFHGWMATVDLLINLFNISDQEMLLILICLLGGDAREWWARMMDVVDSWAEAKQDLKDRYGHQPGIVGNNLVGNNHVGSHPQPTKSTSLEQRHGQRVTDYIDSMEKHFGQLQKKPTVREKVNIVYSGFHAILRHFINPNGVQDLSELSFRAREAEKRTIAAGRWPAIDVGSGFNGGQRHRSRRRK